MSEFVGSAASRTGVAGVADPGGRGLGDDQEMAIKIRPSRRGNFDVTAARLIELGVTFKGYDHHASSYAGIVIPPGLEAVLAADPLIELESDATPKPAVAVRVWSSPESGVSLTDIGSRLHRLRTDAGLDLPAASALTGGKLTPDKIEQIEAAGNCEVWELIALADIYGASLDRLADRAVAKGDPPP